MSHFLHSCRGNHDRHWYLETQDSGGHVYLAHINKYTGSKPVLHQNHLFQRTKREREMHIKGFSTSSSGLWQLQVQIEKLTEFLRKHFCSHAKSTGPLHQMHSNQTPSWATFAWQCPRTHWHWLSPSLWTILGATSENLELQEKQLNQIGMKSFHNT